MSQKSTPGPNPSLTCLLDVFARRNSLTQLMFAAVLLLVYSPAIWAQTNGPVDPGKELGTPRGSYSQSGYEDVNLYNGRMSVGIPLLDVVGRGGAGYSIRVPVQTHAWDVMNNLVFNPNGTITYNNVPFGTQPDLSAVDPYGPGLLEVVTGFEGAASCVWISVTRVVLRTPAGAEIELRDELTDGRPDQQTICPPNGGPWVALNRGKAFHSSDGSAIVFISDADVLDRVETPLGGTFPHGVRDVATGTLIMRDGTRYRYELGILKKMTDRNGNTLVFQYETFVRRLSSITDSLGRVVSFTYGDRTAASWFDEISYTGRGGTPATIRVNFTPLSQSLRPDHTFKTPLQLYPNINRTPPVGPGPSYDPKMISSIVFPNNKQFSIAYNSYAEVARLTLPAGGHIDYEYGGIGPIATTLFTFPDDSGVMWSKFNDSSKIQRRLKERRTYSSSTQLEGTTIYKDTGMLRPVVVDHLNSSGSVMFSEKHHYFTDDVSGEGRLGELAYVWWKANKEFKTEWLNAAGQVLRTVEHNWQQRAPVSWYPQAGVFGEEPANDPRVEDTTTTLNDTGQVSKIDYTYDQFNNIIEEQVFDFGPSAPGALLRKTQTDYLVVNPVNNLDYTSNTIHIVGLPRQIRTMGSGAAVQARTDFEYDNYNDDTNNKPILSRPSIIGLDAAPGGLARGNVTKTQNALNVTNGNGPKRFTRYDVAGNVVSEKDPLGFVTQTEYADAFMDGVSRNAFAYPTLVSTPVPDPNGVTGSNTSLTTATVYDFHTGLVRQSTDANGQTVTTEYDIHGRVTRILRPTGGGETNYEYSDVPGNVFVKELFKQDATRSVETRTYLDGLGKTVREFLRTGIGANPWVVRDIHYDELGRASSVLEPYNVSTPGSTPGTCGQCTATTYDALSRVKTIETPDGSTFQTSYAGNVITTTDQAGKVQKVIKDALGRTREIIEDPSGLAQSTTYDYDALGNVRKIVQAQQQRFYSYDALSRVVRVRNVEDNINPNLPALTDPFTNNSQWSRAMTYDDNGKVTQQTDSRGVVTTFTYDRVNRNTGISYSNDPSGTLPVTRVFDFAVKGKGKPYQTKTTGAGGVLITVESYNNIGSPVTVSQKFDVNGSWSQPYTTTYGYNLSGGVTSITYPSGRSVSYHYDDAGRTDSVTGNLGDTTTRNYSTGISYAAHGPMIQELFGTTAGVYNKRFYNSRNQLAEILASTSGNDSTWNRGKILNQFSMQCATAGAACNATDNNGNVRKQEVFIPTNEDASTSISWHQQYDYDALNRLVRVHEFTDNLTRDWQQEYNYDRWSNRTIHQTNTWGPNIPKPNFGVNASNNNRLTAPAGFSMTYDQAGNVNADTYSGILERVYDANNRMTEAKDANNIVQSYVYDADGRRVRRKINGVETWQIHGLNEDLLAEYPANGVAASPMKEYGYRNHQLLVVAEDSSPNAPAPSALTATPPTGSSNLTLNWSAAQGAVKYRVERKNAGGSFSSIGTTTSTSMTDNGAVSGNAYLYKVCSADAAGVCTSSYSNIVLGAAITFTDPTIISSTDDPTGATVTPVRAVHITQLRTAVNSVRALAGLPNASWTWNVATNQLIHVEDVRELRTALAAALTALQINQTAYIDPTLIGFIENPAGATVIKADHIRQLRQRVTAGIGGSGGPAGSSIFTLTWLITDHLGTPRIAIDLSGSLNSTRRFDYLPFGEELNAFHGIRDTTPGYTPSSADLVRQKFTGKERDNETGLDYFGARYYSSKQGRFTGPDTFGGVADNPQTLNLYLYVNNNPLRAVDPNGHWTFDVMAAFFQDPTQKPPTSPIVVENPNPGNWVKITELGPYNPIEWKIEKVPLDGIPEGVKGAQNWISRGFLSGASNPFSPGLLGSDDLGIPDYQRSTRYPRDPDDFKQVNFSIPLNPILKFASLDFSVTRTRHGNWFLGHGMSLGLAFPSFAPSIVTGQTFADGVHVRSEAQVNSILAGHSFGGKVCLIICLGGSGNTTRAAYLFNIPYFSGGGTIVGGLGAPQINIGKQVTYQLPWKK